MNNTDKQTDAPTTEWERGYFCAVAALIRMDGIANTHAKKLFAAGGNAEAADEEDKSTFLEHKLMLAQCDNDEVHRTRIEPFEPESQDPWLP